MNARAKWILIAVVLAVLAGSGARSLGRADEPGEPGWAPPVAGPGGGLPPGAIDPGLREELGLTEEQAQQLRSLQLESAKQGIRTRAELQIKRLELEELLSAEEPNRAQIDKKLSELTNAEAALTRMRVEHRLAFRTLLTPEQHRKLEQQMRRQFQRERHQRRFDRFGPPRPDFPPGPRFGERHGWRPGPNFDERYEE